MDAVRGIALWHTFVMTFQKSKLILTLKKLYRYIQTVKWQGITNQICIDISMICYLQMAGHPSCVIQTCASQHHKGRTRKSIHLYTEMIANFLKDFFTFSVVILRQKSCIIAWPLILPCWSRWLYGFVNRRIDTESIMGTSSCVEMSVIARFEMGKDIDTWCKIYLIIWFYNKNKHSFWGPLFANFRPHGLYRAKRKW